MPALPRKQILHPVITHLPFQGPVAMGNAVLSFTVSARIPSSPLNIKPTAKSCATRDKYRRRPSVRRRCRNRDWCTHTMSKPRLRRNLDYQNCSEDDRISKRYRHTEAVTSTIRNQSILRVAGKHRKLFYRHAKDGQVMRSAHGIVIKTSHPLAAGGCS